MSFDAQFAKLRGINVTWLYFALVLIIALGVVIIIRAVGLILVIALLTIPPYIAEKIYQLRGRNDDRFISSFSTLLHRWTLSLLQFQP